MSKRALLAKIVQDVRASYWFLPTVLVICALILVQVTLYLDRHFDVLPIGWRSTQVVGARATLSVIAQAMIGVAGVMFSLTIVAVSFASGNFGPRLIGNFMQDRGNQWSLGILIATFVYALLVLRAVQNPFDGAEGDAFVPHLSMLVALGLAGISIMVMIYFVHHIPEIINVANISCSLGGRLRAAIEGQIASGRQDRAEKAVDFPDDPPDAQLCLCDDGYLQTWNLDRLSDLAQKHDLCIEVCHEAGAFMSRFTPVLKLWGCAKLSDDLTRDLRDCFAIGPKPTETQNLLFLAEQLCEMVARALSPGVNDPFTAINCLNWMYIGLGAAANCDGGLSARAQNRIRYRTVSYRDLLEATFDASLFYVKTDPLAMRHQTVLVDRLMAETENPDAREALQWFQSKMKAVA